MSDKAVSVVDYGEGWAAYQDGFPRDGKPRSRDWLAGWDASEDADKQQNCISHGAVFGQMGVGSVTAAGPSLPSVGFDRRLQVRTKAVELLPALLGYMPGEAPLSVKEREDEILRLARFLETGSFEEPQS